MVGKVEIVGENFGSQKASFENCEDDRNIECKTQDTKNMSVFNNYIILLFYKCVIKRSFLTGKKR